MRERGGWAGHGGGGQHAQSNRKGRGAGARTLAAASGAGAGMGLSGVVRTMCTVARVTPHSDVRASVREGRLVHAGAGVTAGW